MLSEEKVFNVVRGEKREKKKRRKEGKEERKEGKKSLKFIHECSTNVKSLQLIRSKL